MIQYGLYYLTNKKLLADTFDYIYLFTGVKPDDELIKDITHEYNITTIIVSHDMNSVIEIGDNILFIHKGENWWTGNKSEILHTTNKELFNFVFAGEFMKSVFKVQNK